MTIDPIIVRTHHACDGAQFNAVAVTVDDAGHVTVKPHSDGYMDAGTAGTVLASTDVSPAVLNNGKADVLIAFKTSDGAVYTVYDTGLVELSAKAPVALSGAGVLPPQTSAPASTPAVQHKRGLPGDAMDTGHDGGLNGAETLPRNVHEGIDN